MASTLRVFPDHCAETVLWNENGNAPWPVFVPHTIRLALQMWAWVWEFSIARGKLSPSAIKEWYDVGDQLVLQMNAIMQSNGYPFSFVYAVDLDGELECHVNR